MLRQEADHRLWTTTAPEDLRTHLALSDRFLRGGRSVGIAVSVVLLAVARQRWDWPLLIYAIVMGGYLLWQRWRRSGEDHLPWPDRGGQVSIALEFYLIAAFLYLSGNLSSHLNLILAMPAVGYAARFGRPARLPIIIGTVGSTLLLLILRSPAVTPEAAAYVAVEAAAILGMGHLAGRPSHRMFRLAWSLSQTVKQQRLLLQVAQCVNQSLAVDETLRNAAEQLRELFDYRSAFFLYDAARDELYIKVTRIFSPEEVPHIRFSPRGTVFEDVLISGEPVVVTDLANHPRLPEITRGRVLQKVAVIVPLRHDGEFLGTMNVGKEQDGTPFSDEELDLLVTIAGLLAQAIHNARRHEEAERLSVVDELTGLYNHRYFQAELERQLQKARRAGTSLTLATLDLDNFKDYNDLFGHRQGDEVLRGVGAILAARFPAGASGGFAARYGGEEFALVMPGDEADAWRRCEEVREAVAGYPFPGRGAMKGGQITVSLGAASFPGQAEERDTLIAAADTALYRAKHLGKNRCEFYTSVLDAIETDILEESEIGLIRTIKPLVSVINGKDNYTYGHSERVVEHVLGLGKRLGLGPRELQFLSCAAFLHDLGKLEISRDLLNKTGPLTPEEWRTLKSHPVWGAEMVGRIASLRTVAPAILHHHERWDGSGYPEGLAGEEIPLFARIIAVADAYDAMITARPYRREKAPAVARNEISTNAGSQFDPEIAAAFVAYLGEEMDTGKIRTA